MHPTALLQTFAEGHHGGMFMGLHWSWWIVWLAIGAALIWALARMLMEPTPDRGPSDAAPLNAATDPITDIDTEETKR